MTARKREPLHQPKTAVGKFMANKFIPRYANKVMGLVYLGAAILIIIVGLRGLGSLAGTVGIIPSFLIGPDNKIDPYWVMFALLLEFGMLLILGIVTFYTPSEYIDIIHTDEEDSDIKGSARDLKNELRELKDFADEELRVVEDYVEKFDSLSKKVREIQISNIQAISKMKETIES
ncbi:hypothetical protein MNBD_IGNAVI01-1264 [hydrothermal vent metagenome]|uniref:Uncharacterized protein n=1 Tax=hydrothermal vent metagenome TaxID=652676 RepID=A0A3B1CFR3_9ZZZZ